jgi:hypothetical protein
LEAIEVFLFVAQEFQWIFGGEEDDLAAGEIVAIAVLGGVGLPCFRFGSVRLGAVGSGCFGLFLGSHNSIPVRE